MDGLKIRTVVADLPRVLVRALGASPTPIPWPELFTSFQTGVVEGSKNGITDIMNMKFPDAGLQYVTLDGHAYMGALWFMNNEKFMSMPEELRIVISDGFYQPQQATFASPKRKSIQAYEEFVAGGGDLYVPTPEEKAAFKEAAAPVYDWFVENVDGGQQAFDALVSSVAVAEDEVNAAPPRTAERSCPCLRSVIWSRQSYGGSTDERIQPTAWRERHAAIWRASHHDAPAAGRHCGRSERRVCGHPNGYRHLQPPGHAAGATADP